jgi:hypothetical protein
MAQSDLKTRSQNIIRDSIPEKDFLERGVCFRARSAGALIDTLIIHSAYVEKRVISPPEANSLTDFSEEAARSLAQQWLSEKEKLAALNDTQIAPDLIAKAETLEFQALHTLIRARRGPAGLTTFNPQALKDILQFYGVSAHFAIGREGSVYEFVAPELLAFHSGKSKMPRPEDCREGVNAFSIGVELLGTEDSGFTPEQYSALAKLTRDLIRKFQLRNFYGHSDIAPGRKSDPQNFDWVSFQSLTGLEMSKHFWPQG